MENMSNSFELRSPEFSRSPTASRQEIFANIKTIHSFLEVTLTKPKTLILCDIDDTILGYDKNFNYFYQQLKNTPSLELFSKMAPYELNDIELRQKADMQYLLYRQKHIPVHCDYIGFMDMVNKVKQTGGDVMFLTARNIWSSTITRNQLRQIGLNYDDYVVYYTGGNVNKGYYIITHIDLDKYNDVIFIDDLEQNIEAVTFLCPTVRCYQFHYIPK
jgi:hypothetical protein